MVVLIYLAWHDGQMEITVPQSMRCHEVDVLAVAW
jgi:hypothetical protein